MANDTEAARKKNIHAWCMYDWSTNAYQVTTASALFPVFFVEAIVPDGFSVFGREVPASALWGLGLGTAALIVLFMAPVLGAIADYTLLKRKFLMAFAWGGGLFASLLFFATPGMVWLALLTFIAAQVCYTSGNVFYNAFLPGLASDEEMDRTSGRGFAYGYLGGGLQFAFALGLVSGHGFFGIAEDLAVRIALVSAGLWWFVFSGYTFLHLKETPPPGFREGHFTSPLAAVRHGVVQTWTIIRQLPKFPPLLLFFVAFFLYNDGIQTVIGVSAAYGSDELRLGAQAIMITFLIVQFVAFGGALLFSRIADRIGTKRAILLSLVVWSGVVTYAYFLQEGDVVGFLILGLIVGIVLGGNQALSRSLFASMIPRHASANFFGFFTVFHKLSAVPGPLLFGGLAALFGSARPAILFLIVFFVAGGILLACVDVEKARNARGDWQKEADELAR